MAAEALIELRKTDVTIVNLVHPKPVPWHDIISSVSSSLNVPVVSYGEWLAKLGRLSNGRRDETEAARRVPALRLHDFYQSMETGAPGRPEDEALMQKSFDTTQLTRASNTLGKESLPSLGSEDVQRWIAHWRRKGVV